MEYSETFEKLCQTFSFDKNTKILSYKNVDNPSNFYKKLLFEFCFLTKEGSFKLKSYKELWFYKGLNNPKEVELAEGIIELLISKDRNISCDISSKNITLANSFLNLIDNKKYEIFKYLQSIFSWYFDNPSYILFPLLYTFIFDRLCCKDNLKRDLRLIVDNSLTKLDLFESIDYSNIDKEFLIYFNTLLHSKDEMFKKIYEYLCSYSANKKNNNEINIVETISYFSVLKDNIVNCGKKFREMEDKKSGKEIDYSAKKNFLSDSTENTENNKSMKVNEGNNCEAKQSKEQTYLNLTCKLIELSILSTKIPSILSNLKQHSEFIDKYHELVIANQENKLLLKKLSSTILLLQNANIINIKRKIVDALLFKILENNDDRLYFSQEYFPSNSALNELNNLIEKSLNSCEKSEKDEIEKDRKKLEEIMKKSECNKTDSLIYVVEGNNKILKILKMVLEFLIFCKKSLHPFVHAEGENINYYLIPSSIFDSNLKCADYLFSMDDMIRKNKIEDKGETEIYFDEFEIDSSWSIYKKNKEISIEKAIDILFNDYGFTIKENYDKNLNEQKYRLKQDLKNFKIYLTSFVAMSFIGFNIDKFQITDDIRNEEEDLINILEEYDKNLSEIIRDEINRNDALKKIELIKKVIIKETDVANDYFGNIKIDKDFNITEKAITSKINKIKLILKFVNDQVIKFMDTQDLLYKKYENSANKIIEKAQSVQDIIKAKYSVEHLNLIDNWIKTKPTYDVKYLNRETILSNLKELISCVKLDIKYSFDEKFVLWAVKNKFSKYMKN